MSKPHKQRTYLQSVRQGNFSFVPTSGGRYFPPEVKPLSTEEYVKAYEKLNRIVPARKGKG